MARRPENGLAVPAGQVASRARQGGERPRASSLQGPGRRGHGGPAHGHRARQAAATTRPRERGLTSQMSFRCLMYTRSVFMISWMTLALICCLLSGCRWRSVPGPSSCSPPGVPLDFSDSSS